MSSEPCKHCGGTGVEPDWDNMTALAVETRESLGLSKAEVARRARCSPNYVSDLESGKRRWDGEAARRVLEVLGLPMSYGTANGTARG